VDSRQVFSAIDLRLIFSGRASRGLRGFWGSHSLPAFLSRKLEFVTLHIDAQAAEDGAFHLQAESLFRAALSGQLDRAAGAEHSVPGQPRNLTQNANHLPGCSGPTGGARDGSIGGNLSRGQCADGADDPVTPMGGVFCLADVSSCAC
jgi:hypothetical protein